MYLKALIKKTFLYLNTIKFLKFEQIFYRIFYRLTSPKIVKKNDNNSCLISNKWTLYNYNSDNINPANGKFFFLNKVGYLRSKNDWNDSSQEKLWLYNLHYFDYLNTFKNYDNKKKNIDLILSWINDNPCPNGVGWEPYTISLRIVNWVKFLLNNKIDNSDINKSIIEQGEFLFNRPEYHIQANHLFSNAKAMLYVGCFKNDEVSKKIFAKGLNILKKQICEQVLNDGAHFELSPMYHSLFLLDILDLINLYKAYPENFNQNFKDKLLNSQKALYKWLISVQHIDQSLPFFNDTCNQISLEFQKINDYMSCLNLETDDIKKTDTLSNNLESGFITLKKEKYFFIGDFSEVKSSYQPGHFHASTLSFELSLNEKKCFVNSGISTYEDNEDRLFQRSSNSYNTITIDNRSSSEVWSSFRLGNRVMNVKKEIISSADELVINSSHDGYIQQGFNCIHNRTFIFRNSSVFINDSIEGEYRNATCRYFLHPDVKIISANNNFINLQVGEDKFSINANQNLDINDSKYWPEFGKFIENKCISINLVNNQLSFEIHFN